MPTGKPAPSTKPVVPLHLGTKSSVDAIGPVKRRATLASVDQAFDPFE